MKKIKYILVVAVIAFSLNSKVSGQETYINMTYDMAIPLGNTADFISKTSFRGYTFEFGWYLNDNLAIDLRWGWQTFYEDLPYDSYYEDTRTLTGKQYRYINSMPITAGLKYFFNPNGSGHFVPYIGAGLGTYMQNVRTDMGIYTVETKQWHFGFYPEVGFVYEFTYGTGFMLNARYDYTLDAGGNNGHSYLTIGVGFHFSL